MSELKVCRICLRTEAKMYHFNLYQLKFYYEEVMAIHVNENDGLPQHFCYECATVLHKFHKFKEKCYSGQKFLKEMLWRGPITYESIYKLDLTNTMLKSPLTMITTTNCVKSYYTKDSQDLDEYKSDKVEKIENIELDYFSDLTDKEDNEPINNLITKIDLEDIDISFEDKIKTDDEFKDVSDDPFGPSAVYIGENIMVKEEELKVKSKGKKSLNGTKKVLDSNYWKSIVLNEDEALKNFRARAEDKKYVEAAYKCTDCFKGFSKEDMLNTHKQLRHDENLGPHECRFCRMRFKLDCYLNKHMRQHYTKFECLRCHLVCPLENTAYVHDEYHSGVTRKCVYCDEEFRHSSTYYTHLRTHRSEHVCTLCGASFVSKAGLRQHKKRKHVIMEIESPDDDEDVNTYCERCDMRFETRKAYEEHLFHSALHSEVEGSDKKHKKILGKQQKAKITKQLRKRSADEEVFKRSHDQKRNRRCRRKHRKPTTCHQCGKHFDTQSACWKHHIAEHPRTSFYSQTDRYICEICGSSLAPGSVANHQNMHTREKLYTCDTCGRQFHAIIGLKRHQVTHTGEKPFACSLCDKRFTQSNSMKLHYRTFHLKQPYPKRIRNKHKDNVHPQASDKEGSATDEDSEGTDLEPDLPEREPGVNPVPNAVLDKTDDNMHYLTLT